MLCCVKIPTQIAQITSIKHGMGGGRWCIRRERKPGEGELGGARADGSLYKTKECVTCIGNASGSCQNIAFQILAPQAYLDVYN